MNQVGKITIVSCFIMIFIFALCALPITSSIIHIWLNDTTFYHCFLVIPLFFIGLVSKKEIFDIYPIRFEPLTMPIIAITSALMVISYWGGFNIIAHFLWVFNIFLICVAAFGRYIVRFNMPLMVFLFFAIPFGTEFIIPLQNLTAFVSVSLLKLTGIDVIYEGIHIITPKARFYVAEACAGLRFLIANIFVCYIFAYLHFHSIRSWILFLSISMIIPILGNCFRAYLIMIIGHYSSGEYAAGVDHLIYGWGFFSVLAFVNLIIGDKIAKKEPIFETITSPKLPFGVYDKTRDKFYPHAHFYEKRIFISFIIVVLTSLTLDRYFQSIITKNYSQEDPNIQEVLPLPLNNQQLEKIGLIHNFAQSDYQEAFKVNNHYAVQMSYYYYQDANKDVASSRNKIHNEKNRFLLAQFLTNINKVNYNVTVNGHLKGQKFVTLMTYFYKDYNTKKVHYTPSRTNIQYQSMLNLLYNASNSAGILLIDIPLKNNQTPKEAIEFIQNLPS